MMDRIDRIQGGSQQLRHRRPLRALATSKGGLVFCATGGFGTDRLTGLEPWEADWESDLVEWSKAMHTVQVVGQCVEARQADGESCAAGWVSRTNREAECDRGTAEEFDGNSGRPLQPWHRTRGV